MILLEPAYKIFHTSVKFKRRTISVTPFSRNLNSDQMESNQKGMETAENAGFSEYTR
jgi:hypothetical protein